MSQLWVRFQWKDAIERKTERGRFDIFIKPEAQEPNSFVDGRFRKRRNSENVQIPLL